MNKTKITKKYLRWRLIIVQTKKPSSNTEPWTQLCQRRPTPIDLPYFRCEPMMSLNILIIGHICAT